jgi:hypothetical protein
VQSAFVVHVWPKPPAPPSAPLLDPELLPLELPLLDPLELPELLLLPLLLPLLLLLPLELPLLELDPLELPELPPDPLSVSEPEPEPLPPVPPDELEHAGKLTATMVDVAMTRTPMSFMRSRMTAPARSKKTLFTPDTRCFARVCAVSQVAIVLDRTHPTQLQVAVDRSIT